MGKIFGIDIKIDDQKTNAKLYSRDNMTYRPAWTGYLKKIMKFFPIGNYDKIFDYGAGKGIAMLFFLRYPFSKIGGIELMNSLYKAALENFKKKNTNKLICFLGDASKFDSIDEYNYFYFYNPFVGDILQEVIEQIKRSLLRNHRKITIIYHNPSARELFFKCNLFPYKKSYFISSIMNRNKDNYQWITGRQFIDVYCTEQLNINFEKHGIKQI